MNYKVKLRGRSHYVMGLNSEHDNEDLMLIYRYPGGDVDTRMKNKDMMLGALYDLYQCVDQLKEGDTFTTEFGEFECCGFHVVGK